MKMEELKQEIEKWLMQHFKNKGSYNKIIFEAMDYSLMVGGKRLRPLLLILSYSLYRDDYKEVMPIACSMEMIHTYSLIHDDLPCMDNDDLRRGKPTSHKVFGEALAVLAGDGLLNEAMDVMFDFCLKRDGKAIKACKVISHSSGSHGMIGGQVVDIISEGKTISFEQLSYMHAKKTGELIKAAIIAGAILGEANEKELSLLEKYGEKLGLAFQIKDDILDVIGDTKLLGKKVRSDLENDKTTFVSTFGLDKCKEKCEILTKECISILNDIPRDTQSLEKITLLLLKREF